MDAISRLLQAAQRRRHRRLGRSRPRPPAARWPTCASTASPATSTRSTRRSTASATCACYPDIASLPAVPDVGIVLLGAERAHLAVRDLAARGTAAAIVLASGYTETGEDGARRQQQLIEAAGSMRILGPNTIGLVNLTDNIVLSATGALEMDHFPVGGIGVVSQSGGILGSLLSRAAARGIGLSKLISTSNEVDLELADFIDHLADDEATKVIALYVETVRNPAKFRAAALKAARAGKPVVAFKIGRSEAGAKAAVSHTGAMAGADRMYDALFRQVGVIRAQTFGDLLDIPVGAGHRPQAARQPRRDPHLHRRRRHAGVRRPGRARLRHAGARRRHRRGAARAADRRPSRARPQPDRRDAGRPAARTCCAAPSRALLASPSYDALTIIVGSSSLAHARADGRRHPGLPAACPTSRCIAYVSPHAPEVGALLTQRGVPAFAAAESCTAALGAHAAGQPLRGARRDAGRRPPRWRWTTSPPGSLDEAQAKQLFARFGVPCARERHRRPRRPRPKPRRASCGGRVVLKILSSQITHKSDVGGVAVGLTPETVGARLTRWPPRSKPRPACGRSASWCRRWSAAAPS